MGPQQTIINQAELLAAPLLAWSTPDRLADADVIWFIDNKAAESALVKAGSPTESMCLLALAASAAFASIRARVRFDYIPSRDNPADVLSREGMGNADVARKFVEGTWVAVHPREPPSHTLNFAAMWGGPQEI